MSDVVYYTINQKGTSMTAKYRLIYISNKSDAIAYYNLLKSQNVSFRLRPYARGFGFFFNDIEVK